MNSYPQHDGRLICLDCTFVTYSASMGDAHEKVSTHHVVNEEDMQ